MDTQLIRNLASGTTTTEQFLSLPPNLITEHGGTTDLAWAIKAGRPMFAIGLHAPFDTIGAHSESADDVHLPAYSLADQLCREHTERSLVSFRMTKDGIDTTEISPLVVVPNDADPVVDLGGSIGNQRPPAEPVV